MQQIVFLVIARLEYTYLDQNMLALGSQAIRKGNMLNCGSRFARICRRGSAYFDPYVESAGATKERRENDAIYAK